MKTKRIGDYDDRVFTIIVNSASKAAQVGLPPKMAEFCHTSNRLLLGCQRRRALLLLYFNSSATGRSVGNKGCRSLRGSLQKENVLPLHHCPTQILGFFRGKPITRFFDPANANGNTVRTK